MQTRRMYSVLLVILGGIAARGAAPLARPDLATAKPIAACKLQAFRVAPTPRYEQPAVLYSLQRPAEDPLTNYERTPLGDWQMPADAERDDPWLRLLLIGPKRPVVIDLAVLIDGESFRDQREAWIDEAVAAARADAAEPAADTPSGNNQPAARGTKPAENASVGDASRAAAESETSPRLGGPTDESEKQPPSVAAQARQAPSMRDRLIHYLETNGDMVEREEIHWLIAEWGAGPAVVVLDPSLSWQRASMAPLLAYLDQDDDGGLSAAEIHEAESLLKRADFDANDVLDVSELRRATTGPPASPKTAGHSLLVPLDANTNWDVLAANLARIYGKESAPPPESLALSSIKVRIAQGDESLDGPQLRTLCEEPADVTLRVGFSTNEEDGNDFNAVSVLSIDSQLSTSDEPAVATDSVISVDIAGDFVEFSAAQAAASNAANAGASQLAVGAVIDGNALERLLDRDQDGRFTLRERQELGGLLAALDRNEDGDASADEIPVPIRLAVTLGPRVHELLANPAGSARLISPREAAPAPPDWFASMDKNRDRDLSRGEFLGTAEQFRQFDTDGDGLLSVAEALKLDAGQ